MQCKLGGDNEGKDMRWVAVFVFILANNTYTLFISFLPNSHPVSHNGRPHFTIYVILL